MVPQPAIAGAVDVRAGAAPVRACLDWRNIGKMFFSILLVSYTDGGLVVVKSNKQTNKHTHTFLSNTLIHINPLCKVCI